MINPITSYQEWRSTRTNFLSVGVTLCAIVAGICVAPLAFVQSWIAVWLLCLVTVLVLGTFGIWAFHAVKNPKLLNTEHHQEQMAAISLLGHNRDNGTPLIESVANQPITENPMLGQEEQR
jgi:fatty acid desaturase